MIQDASLSRATRKSHSHQEGKMLKNRYGRIVRASAIYDLLVTAPFATPWTFDLVHKLLGQLAPVAPFGPVHVLFANLLGSIVVVWSLLRIRDPQPIYGLYDSLGRALFFTWQVYFLVLHHITPIVWLFAVFEFGWFGVQLYGYWLLRKVESDAPSSCRLVAYYRRSAMA
jgi:hypothetical protein